MCCFGRRCQMFTNGSCGCMMCSCTRPSDEFGANSKEYDATICFSAYDENWLDEEFLPHLTQYRNNYKIHKLNLYNDKIGRDNERIMRSSKRIILIFSKNLLEQGWNNRNFLNILRDLCLSDDECIIIALNTGDLSQELVNRRLNYLETPIIDETVVNTELNYSYKKLPICLRFKSLIKYNCGLKKVEKLHLGDKYFWKKFTFIMPLIVYDSTKPTELSSSKVPNKLPPLSLGEEKVIKKKSKVNDYDTQMTYAANYKNSKSLRHMIVPIPDFMRTKLGFSKQKSLREVQRPKIDNDGDDLYSYKKSSSQQQRNDQSRLSFSAISHSNMQTPDRNFVDNSYSNRGYSSSNIQVNKIHHQGANLASVHTNISAANLESYRERSTRPVSQMEVARRRSESADPDSIFNSQAEHVVTEKNHANQNITADQELT